MNLLNTICENKKKEIQKNKKKYSIDTLEKLIKNNINRGFQELILKKNKLKKNNIIGEIKQSSPSAGKIIKNYKPEEIVKKYELSGIDAISILTDKDFFNGKLEDLSLINKNTKLPILRKDFIIDPYQVLQSKFYKADAILLIMSILSFSQAKEIIDVARNYNIDCLIEIHKESEIESALKLDQLMIGINNRNLDNLKVNTNNTINICNKIPKNFTIIAESGIRNKEDIIKYNKNGIYNFLIGESLLKSNNLIDKIKELK